MIAFLDRQYLRGCSFVEKQDNGYLLHRMTPGFLKFYTRSEHDEIRAHCPTGIRITFRTDAAAIRIPVVAGRAARPVSAFDVFIDGALSTTFAEKDELTILSDGAVHTFEIMLPNLLECFLGYINLENAAVFEAVKRPSGKIIFIGDSIMQGMTVSHPALMYTDRLARALNAEAFNVSVGGALMNGKLGALALGCNWDYAMLGFGVNDFNKGRSLEEYSRNAGKVLSALTTRHSAAIFTIGPIPMNGRSEIREDGVKLSDFSDALRDVSMRFKRVRFLNGMELLPREKRFYIDEIHPNDKGEDLLFRNLLKQILP